MAKLLSSLPAYNARSFLKWIGEATEAYYKELENEKRFEEWKKAKEKNDTV